MSCARVSGSLLVRVLRDVGRKVGTFAQRSGLGALLLAGVAQAQEPLATQVLQRSNPLKSHTSLRTATWWNPQENGWGLFVFDQGTVLAPAWFTYDDDGEPIWMIGAAVPQGDGSYQGSLLRFSGRPFNRTDARASDVGLAVGRMTLRHVGDDALRFDYSVDGVSQSKHLVPFIYDGRRLACRVSSRLSRADATNYSDVWWGGSLNAGWGLFLTHLDDDIYALWYTYDEDGEPLFLTVVASRQADGSYAGAVYRQIDGTPWSRVNGQPASHGATQIGTAVFRFDDGERGRFSYTLGGRSDSRPINRFQFGLLPSICESAPAPQAGVE